jgi:hypothetical protein
VNAYDAYKLVVAVLAYLPPFSINFSFFGFSVNSNYDIPTRHKMMCFPYMKSLSLLKPKVGLLNYVFEKPPFSQLD